MSFNFPAKYNGQMFISSEMVLNGLGCSTEGYYGTLWKTNPMSYKANPLLWSQLMKHSCGVYHTETGYKLH